MELTEKQTQFIKGAVTHRDVCNEWKRKIQGMFPSLFNHLNLYTWYKDDGGHLICITSIDINANGPGTVRHTHFGWNSKEWYEGEWNNTQFSNNLQPASTQEVEAACQKEAEKRGFLPGVKYINVRGGGVKTIGSKGKFYVYLDQVNSKGMHVTNSCGGVVCRAGKWSAIHLLTISKSEAEAKLGCKIDCNE